MGNWELGREGETRRGRATQVRFVEECELSNFFFYRLYHNGIRFRSQSEFVISESATPEAEGRRTSERKYYVASVRRTA